MCYNSTEEQKRQLLRGMVPAPALFLLTPPAKQSAHDRDANERQG
nr:MAG TPA: hypothetical protein [Caudoviricetes sp.]